MGHKRTASPRRLPVNEIVAAATNPTVFNQKPGKPGHPQPSIFGAQGPGATMMGRNPHHDSGYQSSTSSLHSAAVLPPNAAAQVPQFPFSSSTMPPMSALSGEQRLALSAKQGSNAKNSQWVARPISRLLVQFLVVCNDRSCFLFLTHLAALTILIDAARPFILADATFVTHYVFGFVEWLTSLTV